MWYRLRIPLTFPDGAVTILTSVWSPLAGFNPVSVTFSKGERPGGAVTKSVSWEWKKVDDIFVPAVVREWWHPDVPGDVDTYNRTVELQECVLNEPLDPKQFEYAALGLTQGDLVLDDVERTVLIMEGGKPVRLAAYNEPYVSDSARRARRVRWIVIANVAVVAVAALIIVIRRRRRTSALGRG